MTLPALSGPGIEGKEPVAPAPLAPSNGCGDPVIGRRPPPAMSAARCFGKPWSRAVRRPSAPTADPTAAAIAPGTSFTEMVNGTGASVTL